MKLVENFSIRHLLSLGISVILVLGMILFTDISEFTDNLTKISPMILLIIVMVYSTAWFLRSGRLHYFLGKMGSEAALSTIFRINIGENALNLILPARLGDVLAVIALKKYVSLPKSIVSIIHIRILDLMALLAFGVLALLFLHVPSWALSAIVFGILLLGSGVTLIFIFNRTEFAQQVIKKLARSFLKEETHDREEKRKASVTKTLTDFSKNYETFLKPSLIFKGLILSLAIWLCDIAVAFLIARGIGYNISFLVIFIAVIFANLTKAIPSTPGGMGVFEASMAALLVFNGVETTAAVTISVLHHLILNLYTLIVGIPGISKIGMDTMESVDIHGC